MKLKKLKVNKILVISLSNIGDVVLTFPVIDILKNDFPDAELSVVIGPKAKFLLEGNPSFKNVYIYNKHQSFLKTVFWIFELRKEKFDLVVDLRNTVIPLLVSPKYRTKLRKTKDKGAHMKEKHLKRLRSVYSYEKLDIINKYSFFVSRQDKDYIDQVIKKEVQGENAFAVVAPSAADSAKQWSEQGFAQVCDEVVRTKGLKIVLVGDENDRKIAQSVDKFMENESINLCGRINLAQLSELLNRSTLAITNDSAPMHLASYLNKPVLSIFGPTNPLRYGPWGYKSVYVKRKDNCFVCNNAKLKEKHRCIESILTSDVIDKLEELYKHI
ncbi:MAG: glycosyltransferase family 9 protein [Candidatus Zapsychrus exili]|nr:glycosyltransferase family 9 protein [Candidatus Zapsychrus exili]